MAVNTAAYQQLHDTLQAKQVTLVAVSKTKPVEDILALYELGQRDFGENYVQELVDKQPQLPGDIRWHFIGHLQSNKVKYIAPFVHLIHGVDSLKLLKEINKQGAKLNRVIPVLLQVHIAQEETKFGFSEAELQEVFDHPEIADWKHIQVRGLMGMASFTDHEDIIVKEFQYLKGLFDRYAQQKTTNITLEILSLGMSSDYQPAIANGSNMVRIGSLLFGARS